MKAKSYNLYILLIIVILAVGIITLTRNILNIESKEVKSAKEFIELLIDKEIIDENKASLFKEEYLNQSIGKTSNVQYSVILGNYAIDIDSDFNVTGFSNKNIELKDKSINVSKEEAILLAEDYIKKISDSEILFKEVKEKDEESNSHYSVVFYKAKDGYPIYRNEITMVIDKYNGKLDAYSNKNIENNNYINTINYNEKEIKDIMNNYFKDINKNVSYVSDGMLSYVSVNGEYILSYIFNIISEPDNDILLKIDNSERSYDEINELEEKIDTKNESSNEEILIIRTDNGKFINLDTSLINK